MCIEWDCAHTDIRQMFDIFFWNFYFLSEMRVIYQFDLLFIYSSLPPPTLKYSRHIGHSLWVEFRQLLITVTITRIYESPQLGIIERGMLRVMSIFSSITCRLAQYN